MHSLDCTVPDIQATASCADTRTILRMDIGFHMGVSKRQGPYYEPQRLGLSLYKDTYVQKGETAP